ncbi:hypothetical protein [Janthinobacterium lividum]|uniref:hypothetical protein n=1 Tax=Janthinobacterium lividum TaxID=29581 RepID=UPI00201E2DDB|nr:hypothetical protein [Janthinobacterium lividum]
MPRKYALPTFLVGVVEPTAYQRWLVHKAQAHVKRDRKRGNATAIDEAYRIAIHAAVGASSGCDAYSGEPLNWTLLDTYDNADSAEGGRTYKHDFALLPTVDHVGDGLGPADFKICGWRVNDAKHDLDVPAFLPVCRAVLEHHGFTIAAPTVNQPGDEAQ